MIISYQTSGVFLWELTHKLGSVRRDLAELKASDLIGNPIEELAKNGYQFNRGAGKTEDLLSLAAGPFGSLLKSCANPSAIVVHHSYGENASLGRESKDQDLMSRATYFPALLLRQFDLDHVPYFGSFASGCTGFLSLVATGAGLLGSTDAPPVVCLTADVRPEGMWFDARREKILTSDAASGFLMGREKKGFQVLGVNYYSTGRRLVPLVEIVKRTVHMTRELADRVGAGKQLGEAVLHYPNIFPQAWDMVSGYLKVSAERHILDQLAERAHCLSSDSVISLGKLHSGNENRLHVVVNFGSGLHLGVCILKEVKAHALAN
jgi:3-oxoacyl-[acyl-carrier-protein] synthase III